ncbi:capsid protein [Paguma larvata circovirus]|uniref:Capsid protein n=1 Tax=Paguma larvata circovirus TaxID=2294094 RepID=A0A3B8GFZ7_9CIRC|nr:capsid protein [Paguma larvata circovirus]BBF98078.1 capsid protein [Paguma larvata circovirus]
MYRRRRFRRRRRHHHPHHHRRYHIMRHHHFKRQFFHFLFRKQTSFFIQQVPAGYSKEGVKQGQFKPQYSWVRKHFFWTLNEFLRDSQSLGLFQYYRILKAGITFKPQDPITDRRGYGFTAIDFTSKPESGSFDPFWFWQTQNDPIPININSKTTKFFTTTKRHHRNVIPKPMLTDEPHPDLHFKENWWFLNQKAGPWLTTADWLVPYLGLWWFLDLNFMNIVNPPTEDAGDKTLYIKTPMGLNFNFTKFIHVVFRDEC